MSHVRTTGRWEFFRDGEIVGISEAEARTTFDYWRVLSDDRGAATLLTDQMWTEIDRLRGIIAGAEIALGRDENTDAAMRLLVGARIAP